ncbi:hypothetical protein D3C72_1601990 [compost metagenome]
MDLITVQTFELNDVPPRCDKLSCKLLQRNIPALRKLSCLNKLPGKFWSLVNVHNLGIPATSQDPLDIAPRNIQVGHCPVQNKREAFFKCPVQDSFQNFGNRTLKQVRVTSGIAWNQISEVVRVYTKHTLGVKAHVPLVQILGHGFGYFCLASSGGTSHEHRKWRFLAEVRSSVRDLPSQRRPILSGELKSGFLYSHLFWRHQ